MAVFKNVIVVAPVSEVACPLPETHPSNRSPSYGTLPSSSSYGVSQTLCKRTKWIGKSRRNKLSKDYIGPPSNFKHLCHVGWNPQTGFATNLDPELKMIFAQAGVTQDHLKDKRTSKKIFETIKNQGGREVVLKETQTKGLCTKSLDHPVPCSELMPCCSCINCQTLSTKDGFEDGLEVPALISKSQGSLHREIPSPPSKRTSQHNLILNLKEVQLKKSKSDRIIPLSQDVLMCQIRKGTPLKPVTRSSTSLRPPSDGGIVAALKDVIQKRHEAIHGSDEECDSENGDEWAV